MPKDLTWDDAEDIGILLSEAHPATGATLDPFHRPSRLRSRAARVQRRPQEIYRRQA